MAPGHSPSGQGWRRDSWIEDGAWFLRLGQRKSFEESGRREKCMGSSFLMTPGEAVYALEMKSVAKLNRSGLLCCPIARDLDAELVHPFIQSQKAGGLSQALG